MTQDELKTILTYNPDTGVFNWIGKPCRRIKANAVAGAPNRSGYTLIGHKGKLHYAHRLAFLFMTGQIPKIVDHINGDPTDNRWCNLREANQSQNNANSKRKGWYLSNQNLNKPYMAQIKVGRKRKHIGCYATQEEAEVAYQKAHAEIFGEFSPWS